MVHAVSSARAADGTRSRGRGILAMRGRLNNWRDYCETRTETRRGCVIIHCLRHGGCDMTRMRGNMYFDRVAGVDYRDWLGQGLDLWWKTELMKLRFALFGDALSNWFVRGFSRFFFFPREDSKLARVIFLPLCRWKKKKRKKTNSNCFNPPSPPPLGENVSENLIRYPIKFLPRKIPQMPEKVARRKIHRNKIVQIPQIPRIRGVPFARNVVEFERLPILSRLETRTPVTRRCPRKICNSREKNSRTTAPTGVEQTKLWGHWNVLIGSSKFAEKKGVEGRNATVNYR